MMPPTPLGAWHPGKGLSRRSAMTWLPVSPSQSMEGRDADTEAFHAADQTVADDAFRGRCERAVDCPRTGYLAEHGAGLSRPRLGRGHRLAVGGRCDRREPDGAAVRQRRCAGRCAVPRRARLGSTGARAQAARRQSDGAVGRIPGDPPRGLRVQPFLPAVPRIRATAVANHASAACRRTQGVRRLLRQTCADRRPGDQ